MKKIILIFCAILVAISLVHAYPLVNDGSFENNCSVTTCQYKNVNSGSDPPQTIGSDWNFTEITNDSNFVITKDTNLGWSPTAGQYYGIMQLLQNFGEMDLKNLQFLNGGYLYFDANFSLSFFAS